MRHVPQQVLRGSSRFPVFRFSGENFGNVSNPLIDTLLAIYLSECQSRWDFFRRCSLHSFRFAATAGIRNALKSPAKWINAIPAVVDWHGDTKSIDTRCRCYSECTVLALWEERIYCWKSTLLKRNDCFCICNCSFMSSAIHLGLRLTGPTWTPTWDNKSWDVQAWGVLE